MREGGQETVEKKDSLLDGFVVFVFSFRCHFVRPCGMLRLHEADRAKKSRQTVSVVFLWNITLTMGLDCKDHGCREVRREVRIAPLLVLPCSHLHDTTLCLRGDPPRLI